MRKLALLTFGMLLFALVLPTNSLAWQPPGSATTLRNNISLDKKPGGPAC